MTLLVGAMSRLPGSHAGRAGRPWRRLQAQVYAEEQHCWICGHDVDQTLAPQHPYARSVDHLIQLCHQGPPNSRGNSRLAHRRCNTRRGNQLRKLSRNHCACTMGKPCARLDTDTRYTTSSPRVGGGDTT